MTKKNGNGRHGAGIIVNLHAEVVELRSALARHHSKLEQYHSQLVQYHQQSDRHLGRIARMISAMGDVLRDHEDRLAAVEAKVG